MLCARCVCFAKLCDFGNYPNPSFGLFPKDTSFLGAGKQVELMPSGKLVAKGCNVLVKESNYKSKHSYAKVAACDIPGGGGKYVQHKKKLCCVCAVHPIHCISLWNSSIRNFRLAFPLHVHLHVPGVAPETSRKNITIQQSQRMNRKHPRVYKSSRNG